MAFKTEVNTNYGIFPEAYCIIDKISMNKIDKEVMKPNEEGHMILTYVPELVYFATLRIYPEETARNRRAMPMETIGIEFEWNGTSNIWEVAYESAKKNEKFQGKIKDC